MSDTQKHTIPNCEKDDDSVEVALANLEMTLCVFSGLPPTEKNVALVGALSKISSPLLLFDNPFGADRVSRGGMLLRGDAPISRSVSRSNKTKGDNAVDDGLLQETILASMGLPPTSSHAKALLDVKSNPAAEGKGADFSSISTTIQKLSTPNDEDAILREMIHLSTGLPPTTTTTEAILTSAADQTFLPSLSPLAEYAFVCLQRALLYPSSALTMFLGRVVVAAATDTDPPIPANTNASGGCGEEEEALRQAVHLMAGLPPTTRTTARVFDLLSAQLRERDEGREGDGARSSKPTPPTSHSSSSLSRLLRLPETAAKVSWAFFPSTVQLMRGAFSPRDRASPEAVAGRSARRLRAKAPNGIQEELIGF